MKFKIFLFFTAIVSTTVLNAQKTLSGKVPTEYYGNYELRAQTLKTLVEKAEVFYEKHYPKYKFTVNLKLLDSLAWTKLPYPMPYGMPHYDGGKNIILAVKKNMVFPDASPDDKISAYDAIVIHELGHYFMGSLVDTNISPNWANEFIATYFQVIYAHDGKLAISIPSDHAPKHRSLEDFEKGFQVVGDDYGWYQGQFMVLAERLHAKHKFQVLDAFIENYQPTGKKIDASELLRSIDREVFDTWLEEMK